jgi:phage terminase large subunit-like protein
LSARSLMLDFLAAGRARLTRHRRSLLTRYRPYARQAEFHAAGAEHRERLLMAGNQLGKSFSGAAELAIHATGRYPAWWSGRRFERPIRAWAGSKTGEVTRDGVQRMLLGEPKDKTRWGEGMIPGECLAGWSLRRGVADALDSVQVKHASGALSTIGFKTYDQGRQKWQAESLDLVWFDEEPPLDIYIEGLTRTNATGGMVFVTFTPLLGMTEVVSLFLGEP